MKKYRVIAFYLPQFHPIKENDEWWGKGFTEWRNVTKSKPRFRGHYQPHLPADLGFYDLRIPEVREEQANLAKEYGIDGFCYYHYWFNGRRILERPFNEVYNSGKPNFPFMLCWANETWSRTWQNKKEKILIEQSYSEEDDLNHIRYLLPIFKDPRYIKIDGKPVFVIYRSHNIPNLEQTLHLWRNEALKEGMELYICGIEDTHTYGVPFSNRGGDAFIEFQPFSENRAWKMHRWSFTWIINSICSKIGYSPVLPIILSYRKYVREMCRLQMPTYKRYPCITPMWDNSARKKRQFFAFKGSTPELYKKWFIHIFKTFLPYSKNENLIFINAWNEWAEGNHLEPDLKWGMKYLEKTKEIVSKYNCD